MPKGTVATGAVTDSALTPGLRLMASRTVGRAGSPAPWPTPRGSAALGMIPAFARDPLGTLLQTAQEHGDVVYLRMGPRRWHIPTFLIAHPTGVRRVLATGQQIYRKSFTSLPARSIFGLGLLTSDGPSWVAQRQLVRPLFRPDRLAPLDEVTTEVCRAMTERWHGYARTGTTIDVGAEMARASLEVLLRAVFGVPLSDQDANDVRDAFTVLSEESWRRTTSTLWWLLPRAAGAAPTSRSRRFRHATATLDRVVRRLVDSRQGTDPATASLLSLLLEARDEAGGPLPWPLIRDEVATFLVAGHETTAASLTWAWYLLGRQPEAYQPFRDSTSDTPSATALAYARAVVNESLRLYPPAWSIVRDATVDDEIDGYPIPAGSVVITSPYVTHRLDKLWHRPEEFDPSRFLDPPEQLDSHTFFPFGTGMRRCVGERLAMQQAILVMAWLAARFTLRPVESAPVAPQAAVTLRPSRPIRMAVDTC